MAKKINIKGVTAWANLETVNDMSGKYQIDLCQLSDAAVDALEKLGIPVATKDEKGSYVTCKSTRPIRVYDEDEEEEDRDEIL